MASVPRVIIADDHSLVGEGIRRLLQADFDVVQCVTDGRALVDAVAALRPDLIVTDVAMPQLGGLSAIRTLRQQGSDVRAIVLTMHADPFLVAAAFSAGASGYVLKHAASEELILAINEALAGRIYVPSQFSAAVIAQLQEQYLQNEPVQLTNRQQEVLALISQGASIKHIAARLNISRRTVEAHKYQLMRTLGVNNMAELVRHAIRRGIVAVDRTDF
jgi:DNA-binding NarL/FixJ family response regulator